MRKQIVPTFHEIHSYNASGFSATNEELQLFNEMLGKLTVNRALCIASGGEALLTVILHRASEIIAVDHSNRSLCFSIIKMLMLKKLGAAQYMQMLQNEQYADLLQISRDLQPLLPPALRQVTIIDSDWRSVRREAGNLKVPRIYNTSCRKIKFVHGDYTDVEGQFDLFYSSNIHEHVDRKRTSPSFSAIANKLVIGGTLLFSAGFIEPKSLSNAKLEVVSKIRGFRTSWVHCVAKRV